MFAEDRCDIRGQDLEAIEGEVSAIRRERFRLFQGELRQRAEILRQVLVGDGRMRQHERCSQKQPRPAEPASTRRRFQTVVTRDVPASRLAVIHVSLPDSAAPSASLASSSTSSSSPEIAAMIWAAIT